jgi:hypothetical protein
MSLPIDNDDERYGVGGDPSIKLQLLKSYHGAADVGYGHEHTAIAVQVVKR